MQCSIRGKLALVEDSRLDRLWTSKSRAALYHSNSASEYERPMIFCLVPRNGTWCQRCRCFTRGPNLSYASLRSTSLRQKWRADQSECRKSAFGCLFVLYIPTPLQVPCQRSDDQYDSYVYSFSDYFSMQKRHDRKLLLYSGASLIFESANNQSCV